MPAAARPAGFRSRRAAHRDSRARCAAASSNPCQWVRKRASVCCSTGSTSRRSLASDLRRIWRRISASHHSRWRPPGRKPPSSTRPSRGKLAQRIFDSRGIERKALRGLAQRERPVRARIAAHQFQHRMRHRLKQRHGQPRRQRNAQAHRDSAPHLRRQSAGARRQCAVQAGAANEPAGRHAQADPAKPRGAPALRATDRPSRRHRS